MSTLIGRFIYAADIEPEQSWLLLDWCLRRGAAEFTLTCLSVDGAGLSYCRDVEVTLGQFRLPDAPREHMTTAPDQEWVRPAHLWALTPGSAAVLRRLFPRGLFAYHGATPRGQLAPEGWLEDPTFYRDGVIMLGIVSHEGAAMLEVSAEEHREVAAIGIRTRGRAPWEPVSDE